MRILWPALALTALPLVAQPVFEVTPASLTTLPSLTPSGPSRPVALTASGDHLLLWANAPNLAPGQTSDACGGDLYVQDLATNAVELISHATDDPGQCVGVDALGSLSADGRHVAFASASPRHLAAGVDTNSRTDVFVYDRQSGAFELITHPAGSPNTPTARGGFNPLLTPDGRYVVFASAADDLVTGITDPIVTLDVFRRDRQTGVTTLLTTSATHPGEAGNGDSRPLAVTPDGRYVLITSQASNLVSGFTTLAFAPQLYRIDTQTGAATLVTRVHGTTNEGMAASLGNGTPRMSDNGRFITFSADASNLVAGQVETFETLDVFLADLQTGTMTLVSHAVGQPTTGALAGADLGAMSADGRWVAFDGYGESFAPAAVTGISSNSFLFDRDTGERWLVSRLPGNPTTGTGDAATLEVSGDGTKVLYRDAGQLFLFDRPSGTRQRVTHTPAGLDEASRGTARDTLMTPSAGTVVFASAATDLVASPGDNNGQPDAFRFVAATAAVQRLSNAALPWPEPVPGGGASTAVAITPDGRWGLLRSEAPNLVAGDDNGASDAFLLDRHSGERRLLSHAAANAAVSANGATEPVAITPNGRFVLLSSWADDLGFNNGPTGDRQVYRYDRQTASTQLLSHAAGSPGTRANGDSRAIALSEDGRFVLFWSRATDLVAAFSDTNFVPEELFLHDAVSGVTRLVTHAAGSAETTCNAGAGLPSQLAWEPQLSPDGRFVLFSTTGSNLATGVTDNNGLADVYLFDRATLTNSAVSIRAGSEATLGASGSRGGGLSADGRFVAFVSPGTDLVAGVTDTNTTNDVFVRDRQLGTTELISRSSTGLATGNRESYSVALTPDGRFVLLSSRATDLLAPQAPPPGAGFENVFLFDRTSGTMDLISRSAADPTVGGDGPSRPIAVSSNGHAVLFDSLATNLPAWPGVSSGLNFGVYHVNRRSGAMSLVSRLNGPPVAVASLSAAPLSGLADHGNVIWFHSMNPMFVPNDSNATWDAFFASSEIFVDGFESADTGRWSLVLP